jgi:hypothetical protein
MSLEKLHIIQNKYLYKTLELTGDARNKDIADEKIQDFINRNMIELFNEDTIFNSGLTLETVMNLVSLDKIYYENEKDKNKLMIHIVFKIDWPSWMFDYYLKKKD